MTIDLRTRQGYVDLKNALDARPSEVLALCRIALPAKKGGTILIDDPKGSGHNNFAIWLKADGLSWKNFTNAEYKGRSLELIAYMFGWYHLENRGAKEAARFAAERLGLGKVTNADLERDRKAAQEIRHKAEIDEAKELKRQRANAFTVFKDALPILGTAGETYLREARGIDLRANPFIGPRGGILAPHALRFVPKHKYIHRDKAGNKTGESEHPCMICCAVDGEMRIAAIHQTYLRDDGRDKVSLPPAPDGFEQKARKVFPSSRGCVLPLWNGEGNLPVFRAIDAGILETLTLTEGVEDGLSAVIAAPKYRTWGAISLSNIVNVAARLPASVDSIIIHRQNDWEKPEAVKQFDRSLEALRATGCTVAEVRAAHGKDLNDTLRGQ